jgi:hypothetical protein
MRCSFFFENEIAVYFIRDQDQVVAFAELRKLEYFLFGEYTSQRILRIAEKEKLCAGGNRGFHGIPVKDPLGILEDVGNGEEIKTTVTMNLKEGRIYRCAGEEGLPRRGECPACEGQGGHKSSKVNKLLSGG